MKQISKKLSLKKKTVAVLNDQELNQVVGGKKTRISYCSRCDWTGYGSFTQPQTC